MKMYRHNADVYKSYGVCEPDDVDFGKARTFNGYHKKFVNAGYRKVYVTLRRDGYDTVESVAVYIKDEA